MVPKFLLAFGLALAPFIFSHTMDSRLPKEMFCLTVALSIVLVCIYQGQWKPFKNKWFLLLVWFVLLSIHCAPVLWDYSMIHYKTPTSFQMFRNFTISEWHYKPLAYSLIYGLLLISVASIDFSEWDLRMAVSIMAFAGFIMGAYVLVQYIGGLDQFFKIASVDQNARIRDVTQPLLFGTLGNSTIVSAFIAMAIPLALYLRKWIWAIVMCVAVVLTESKMAIGSMAVSSVVYVFWRYKPSLILSLVFFSVLSFGIYQYTAGKGGVISYIASNDSARIGNWKDALTELKGKQDKTGRPFAITGLGPGSYRNVYVVKSGSIFEQAHNDPLELLICLGIVGFTLFGLSLWELIKRVFSLFKYKFLNDGLVIALSCSFLCIFLDSLGSFPFQIHPILFYTIVIVGILYNPCLDKGDL